jgi:hypothetical protein
MSAMTGYVNNLVDDYKFITSLQKMKLHKCTENIPTAIDVTAFIKHTWFYRRQETDVYRIILQKMLVKTSS